MLPFKPLVASAALVLVLSSGVAPAFGDNLVRGETHLAGATIEAECREGCQVSGEIRDITSRRTEDGREIAVSWQLGSVPPTLKLRTLVVAVAVTIENGKVLEGSRNVGVQFAGNVAIPVKGGFLGLNKGKREKVRSVTAKLLPFAELREEAIPTLKVLSAEVKDVEFASVAVVYELGKRSPCDTTTGLTITVDAVTDTGHKLHAKETVPFSSGNQLVHLEGVGRRRAKALQNVRAKIDFDGRPDNLCVISKTVSIQE